MADEVQEQVSLPAGAHALADGLKSLVLAVVANHKALSGSVMAEVSADVTAAVGALGPSLSQLGLLGSELKADAVGVAEAFAIAGFEVAKGLLSK